MNRFVLSVSLSILLVHAPVALSVDAPPYVAGHKTACLSYDEVAWDPKEGKALQFLVDIGYFPPGVDFAVSQLAYSLSTPRGIDSIRGSSRLLLNQIWYPVHPYDAAGSDTTVHTNFFTNDMANQSLATSLSTILNVGDLLTLDPDEYPNQPAGYGFVLASDPQVTDFVVNGPAGSVEGAPIAANDGPFPLIVLDSQGHEQLGLAERLAERGYIVVAPSHPNDQFYDGILNIGNPDFDGLPIGGIPYGLNCSDAQIDAAKPINGILDFSTDIEDVWLAEDGIYLGTHDFVSTIQDTLALRAIDIGMLISRAAELFVESNVVDNERVGLLGYSIGGNVAQLAVSDDTALADDMVTPLEARGGLDAIDATVALAGNNRFVGSSSNATEMLKPSLALQGRQDLFVNGNAGSTYDAATLNEPNPVFADNYQSRYANGVSAMRVLVDRFGHSDFQSSEPLIACLEHGGSTTLVPATCVSARDPDQRFGFVADPAGGITIGGDYTARSLEERLAIPALYMNAWFDVYVKGELCSNNIDVTIDGETIPASMNNMKRLQKNHFDNESIERRHRNLMHGGVEALFGEGTNGIGKSCD